MIIYSFNNNLTPNPSPHKERRNTQKKIYTTYLFSLQGEGAEG
jgi:hypothetical protein